MTALERAKKWLYNPETLDLGAPCNFDRNIIEGLVKQLENILIEIDKLKGK